MRIPQALLATSIFISSTLFCSAQTTASGPPSPANGAPPATAAPSNFSPAKPSDILKRPLSELEQVLGDVKLDKWKKGTVRDEASNNMNAISRDLQHTLPTLVTTADSAPGTLSKVLPVSRNVDALYDVLVHLVEGARVSAPGDQAGELQQVMGDLEKARVTLGEQMVQTASMQEKQIVDLRTTVQTQAASLRAAATTPPPAPKCPVAPAPAKKKKKPATATTTGQKPAAGTPATTTPPKPQQ